MPGIAASIFGMGSGDADDASVHEMTMSLAVDASSSSARLSGERVTTILPAVGRIDVGILAQHGQRLRATVGENFGGSDSDRLRRGRGSS